MKKNTPEPSLNERIAKQFNCPVENLRVAYRRCAKQLRGMEAQARRSHRKLRGFTAEQLAEMAARMEARCAS